MIEAKTINWVLFIQCCNNYVFYYESQHYNLANFRFSFEISLLYDEISSFVMIRYSCFVFLAWLWFALVEISKQLIPIIRRESSIIWTRLSYNLPTRTELWAVLNRGIVSTEQCWTVGEKNWKKFWIRKKDVIDKISCRFNISRCSIHELHTSR